jgi:hypothetical protein
MNSWTRRQFVLFSTAATLQLMTGCAPKKTTVDGKPMHHLTKGFRNYPLAPEPATPGISFLFRRIRESYDKPDIPKGHVMEEALALSAVNQHAAASAITWIGHSTYLLRLENRHFLLDPFFSGDTGYSPTVFKEVGQQFRSFDMAIVPIGAYDPANVMQPVHTNPEEAIQVANDVRADLIIPSHWGTIALTDEPPFEPVERYRAFAIENGIRDERASIMKIGETRMI